MAPKLGGSCPVMPRGPRRGALPVGPHLFPTISSAPTEEPESAINPRKYNRDNLYTVAASLVVDSK